jgi:ankyrin repeat protein
VKRILKGDINLRINEVEVRGNTALHFIARADNVKLYDLLVKRGADENIKNSNGQTPLELLKIAKQKVLFLS